MTVKVTVKWRSKWGAKNETDRKTKQDTRTRGRRATQTLSLNQKMFGTMW